MPPSVNLILPRKQSSCSVILILTFSGYVGQGKTRLLREKISVILCKFLKILVFLVKGGVELHLVCLENTQKIGFNQRGLFTGWLNK